MRGLTHPRFFYVVIIRRSTRASSPVRQRKVVSNKLFSKIRRLYGELYRCGLCTSAPLPLCVKIFHRRVEIHFLILSILLILSKKCASLSLCLCVNFITETQRHRVFFILLCPSAPLPLCVKILLSQSRDLFPNLVNPVNPVKKVCLSASVPLC